MTAQYRGQPLGGLLKGAGEPDDGTDCRNAYCYLDHDQRITVTTGFQLQMPWRANLSANVVYGSGVLAGDGPNHLPGHTTADAYISKALGDHLQLGATVLNLANSRFPFDVSSSFAGSHFNNPREIYGSLRYRFHF
jgi:outer membrane receptor protein involved in Fe transport